MKITFTVETPNSEDTVQEQIKTIAKYNGWEENIVSGNSEDGKEITTPNPVTPQDYIRKMLNSFLQLRMREAYTKEAQSIAISEAREKANKVIKSYNSTISVE